MKVVSRSSVFTLTADFLLTAELLTYLELFQVAVIGVGDEHCKIVSGAVGKVYSFITLKPQGVGAF